MNKLVKRLPLVGIRKDAARFGGSTPKTAPPASPRQQLKPPQGVAGLRQAFLTPLACAFSPLVLFLACSLLASPPYNDKIATIEQTYQSTQTLQAEFVQSTYVDLLEKTITRPGRLFYQKGGKLRMEYAGDKMTHYVSDGKTLWVIDPQNRNIDTFSLKDSGLPEEALKFLTDLGHLREYFHVTDKNGKIVLRPKKKTTYRSLECMFNGQHYLKELTIHTLSGNTSEYRFFNITAGVKLPPKLFRP